MTQLKVLIATLVMPLPLALLLLCGACALWYLQRMRLARHLLGATGLFLFLTAWAPLATLLLTPLEQRYPAVLDARAHPDALAVVVLGSAHAPEKDLAIFSQLSATGVVRLAEGIRLYRQQDHATLIVVGGSRQRGEPIATGYARGARALGVSDQAIIALDTPLDTAQEAQAVHQLLGDGASFFLVTSAAHMPRAVAHFSRVGLQPIPAPTHHLTAGQTSSHWQYWVPAAAYLRMTERAMYEYLAMWSIPLDHPPGRENGNPLQ